MEIKYNTVTEYNNAVFINSQRIPYVLNDSISFDSDNQTVTLSLVASKYERVFENVDTEVPGYQLEDHVEDSFQD